MTAAHSPKSYDQARPIVVQLTGGLGNQLFGFAAALGIARALGKPLLLDCSQFSRKGEIRASGLDCYNLPFPKARKIRENDHDVELKFEGRPISLPLIEEHGFRFDPSLVSRCSDGGYIKGYFQSYKYLTNVADELVELLSVFSDHDDRGTALKSEIENSQSVGIHVRRGDYLKSPYFEFHGICQIDYFHRAIQKMRSRCNTAKFYVFSDDADWCVDHFKGEDIVIASGNRSPNADLDLLASCKKHIISNSSFGWWGAWLSKSQDRSVIAPCPWYTRIPLVPDLIPKDWELLHRTTGDDWSVWEDRIAATRVSAIIPAHRRVKPLGEAVVSALSQTHKNLDVTIVLSSASDEVKEEALRNKELSDRVSVVSAPSPGPSAARNAGALSSNGQWLAFLDDDDLWFPDKIRSQLTAAILFGQAAVSCDHSFTGIGLSKFRYPAGHLSLKEALIVGNFFSGGSAAIVLRDVFLSIGGFDETLFGREDQDCWRRISLNHEIMILAEPLLDIRRLDESHSHDNLMMFQSQMQHLVKVLKETPAELNYMTEVAIRDASQAVSALARARGFEIATDGELLRAISRKTVRNAISGIDSLLPGTARFVHFLRKCMGRLQFG